MLKKGKGFFLILMVVLLSIGRFAFVVGAQDLEVNYKNVLKEHPRVYFTKDDTKSIKDSGFRKVEFLKESKLNIPYYGGLIVTFDLPPTQPEPMGPPPGFTSGDYPYWTALSNNIKTRLEGLAISYIVTGDKQYANRAKEYAISLAKWDTWEEHPNSKLSLAHFTFGMVAVYDFLYDELTPQERAIIRDAVIEKAIVPLSNGASQKIDHNIQLLGNSGLGLAALAFLGDVDGMEIYIEQVKDFCLWYFDERLNSGNTEGLLYTSYAMDNLVRFADALMRVTGDDALMNHPYLRDELPKMIIYFTAPGGKSQTNFSDAGNRLDFDITMRVLANKYDDGYIGWLLKKSGKVSSGRAQTFEEVVFGSKDIPETPPVDWPTSKTFNIGWTALRSGWGDKDTLIAFNSSSSRLGHNHMDQNHFILNTNGEWLIIDPGYQDYSAGPKHDVTHSSMGHNTLIFDGRLQGIKGGGETIGFFTSPFFDYVAGDATICYFPNGPDLWQRDIIQIKPDYFLLVDEVYTSRKPVEVEAIFRISPNSKVLVGNKNAKTGQAVKADRFSIHKAGASVMVQHIWPKDLSHQFAYNVGATEFGPYIKVLAKDKVSHEAFISLIHTVASKDARIRTNEISPLKVETKSVDNYVSILVEKKDRILFNKTDGLVNDGNIATDGRYGVVSSKKGDIEMYALIEGKELLFGKTLLAKAEAPVDLSLGIMDSSYVVVIQAEEPTAVEVWVPKRPKEILKDGVKADFSFNEKQNTLSIKIESGITEIELR